MSAAPAPAPAPAPAHDATPELGNFNEQTTAMQVVASCDLRGKCAVVTGANRGIGFETAKALASRGCMVIFACRDLEKAKDAISLMKKQQFSAQCDAIKLDLASLDSVRHFVEEYLSKYDSKPLNYLVLNAAIYPTQHQLSTIGYEMAYQTQHLSNFYLVQLLGGKLAMSAPSRVVVLSCATVQLASQQAFDPASFTAEFFTGQVKNGSPWLGDTVFANSKVLNVLFASELSRQLANQKVTVLTALPKITRTNLYQKDTWKHLNLQLRVFCLQSAEQAAATCTFCCVFPGLERYSGYCFTDCQVTALPKWMGNHELHKRVWSTTESALKAQSGDLSDKTNRLQSHPPEKKKSRPQKLQTDIAASSASLKVSDVKTP